ncbi:hypothetical protein, partial [Muriicola jejuensis]|uniref:hypothetical protein n=1 Tax=Muriicola jejuensis TaxID=504488 RepID=UPI001953B31D
LRQPKAQSLASAYCFRGQGISPFGFHWIVWDSAPYYLLHQNGSGYDTALECAGPSKPVLF